MPRHLSTTLSINHSSIFREPLLLFLTMQSTTAPPPEPFPFPREYFFPPFFTRQTNLTTHFAQLTKWAALVLAYCRHHRIFKLPLSASAFDSSSSSGSTPSIAEDLFHNRKLNRRLSLADAREVVDFLRKDGRAEYVSGDAKEGGDLVWIYWRTPEEWAALVEAWVEETAQKGTVLTLYELTEGEGTRGTGEFPHLNCRDSDIDG